MPVSDLLDVATDRDAEVAFLRGQVEDQQATIDQLVGQLERSFFDDLVRTPELWITALLGVFWVVSILLGRTARPCG